MITDTRILALLAAATLFPLASASAQVQILAIENEPIPGVPNQYYDSFGPPVVDDTGVVFFKADWGVALEDGGVMMSENGSTSMLLQEGVDVDGLSFTLGRFYDVAVSPSGLSAGVAAVVSVLGGGGTTDSIIMVDTNGVRSIHYDGDPVPVGIGTAFIRNSMELSISRNGSVAYSALLGKTPGGVEDDRALFQFDPSLGTYSEIVREGDLFPEGDGVFGGTCSNSLRLICTPLLNEFGEAAFIANGGIFVNNEGAIRTSVRFGEPIGSGSFDKLSYPRINSSGVVAFSADIQGSSSFDAVFIESDGVLNAAPLGGAAPTSSGGFFGTFRTPITTRVQFNDRGEVSFGADTTEQNPQGNGRIGEGLFVFDGVSVISLARKYEQAPGGGEYGTVLWDDSWMMNDSGQVLYRAWVDVGGPSDRETLFLYTPGAETQKILATGDVVEGQVVTNIYDIDSGFAAAGALNARGEVVVHVRLDGDLDAIVLIGGIPNCPADFTGDGVLNFFDVSAFLQAFAANDPLADFTNDGIMNFFDVSAFLQAFSAGCP